MSSQKTYTRKSPAAAAANRKRSKAYLERQALRMTIIAPMLKHGATYMVMRAAVMEQMGLKAYSLQTLHEDVKKLLADWREARLNDTEDAVQLELQRIDELVHEAWQAWIKSKEDYTKTKVTGIPSKLPNAQGKSLTIKQEDERIRGFGDPRYLEAINKQLQERRKLLGLYAPEQKEINGNMSFAAFLMQTGIVDSSEDNEIEI